MQMSTIIYCARQTLQKSFHTLSAQRTNVIHGTLLSSKVIQRTMATGSKVHLEATLQPQFYVKGLTAESANKTSELLQVNHEKHHIFFNQSGFHVRLIYFSEVKHVTDIRRTTSPTTYSRFSHSTPLLPRSKKATMTMSHTSGLHNR